jgi:protein-histidine pros-kinase
MATILIIDDRPTNRDVLRTVLGYKDHCVIEAEDGAEGLEMARATRPDLIIADILMPRMDGYEMVRRLRSDPAVDHTPVIFYTATYLKSEALKLAEACGVSHLIIKPSDPQDILDTVSAALSETTNAKPLSENFDREHLRLMTDKLAQKVCELEESNHRLIEEAAQRRIAEEALRSGEDRMRAILDSVMDAIITVDSEGNVIEINPAAEAKFGYARATTIGKPLPPLIIAQGSTAREAHGLAQYIAEHGAPVLGNRVEATALTAGGAELPIELTVTPILGDGKALFTAYIRDLTEQKAREEMRRRSERLEQENRYIQESNRLKSRFVANMSHELRTPLNAIIGFSQLMHDGKVGAISEMHKELTADILTSGHHLLDLINDILDLSKVEAGKMEFHPEPLDVATVFKEVQESVRPLNGQQSIVIEMDLDRSLGEVFTDKRTLKQVLYNYLSNAIKFTHEGGRITLRSRCQPPDCLRIEVEDNGIGIRAEDIKKLFLEFEQLDNCEGKKYAGTGLGLALTKKLVEIQGGQVGVRSEPGKGSLFYAVLPHVFQSDTGHGAPGGE